MISFYHTVSGEQLAGELLNDDEELAVVLVELGEGCENSTSLVDARDWSEEDVIKLEKLRRFLEDVITGAKLK